MVICFWPMCFIKPWRILYYVFILIENKRVIVGINTQHTERYGKQLFANSQKTARLHNQVFDLSCSDVEHDVSYLTQFLSSRINHFILHNGSRSQYSQWFISIVTSMIFTG